MRLDQFTVKAQEALTAAQTLAEKSDHPEVTPEHLLKALLEQEGGVVPSALGSSVGMDHFCFMVDASSIDDIIVDLRQAGIDIVKGPEKRRDGTAVFVHDPDGVRVELQIKRPTTQE